MPILAAGFAAAVWLSGAAPVATGWSGSAEDRAATDASKPINEWTTADLADRFPGCVAVADAPADQLATEHVVKHDAGRPLEVMPRQEVADRLEVFGGTVDQHDDVQIIGSCFS